MIEHDTLIYCLCIICFLPQILCLLSCSGEVTPGLTQTEYEVRRQRLALLVEAQSERQGGSSPSSSHVVVVLSHPTRYMTNDIPYPFHQNQDFLYLTGIMEPDSALVLHGTGRPDNAILFVPRRDPARELWDGPRSGKDGASALTGVERVHSTEELSLVLRTLKGELLTIKGTLHRISIFNYVLP